MKKILCLVLSFLMILPTVAFADVSGEISSDDRTSLMNVFTPQNDKLIVLITVVYLICTALAMCLYKLIFVRYAILFAVFIAILIKREKVIEIVKNIKKKD
jgi:hypothetical protein